MDARSAPPPARLTRLVPMLRTRNVAASTAFYVDVLGFECVARADDGQWASLRRDAVEIMLSAPNEHEGDRAPAFTGSLYIRTTDVDELWESVQGHARVCYPLENFDYGMREFAIYDDSGYLLQFGRPLDPAEEP